MFKNEIFLTSLNVILSFAFKTNTKVWRTSFLNSSQLLPESGHNIKEHFAESLLKCNMIANDNQWSNLMCFKGQECFISDQIVPPSFESLGLSNPVMCLTNYMVSDQLQNPESQESTTEKNDLTTINSPSSSVGSTTPTVSSTGSPTVSTTGFPSTTFVTTTTTTSITDETVTSTQDISTTQVHTTTKETTTILPTTFTTVTTATTATTTTEDVTTSLDVISTTMSQETTTTADTTTTSRPALVDSSFVFKQNADYQSAVSACKAENAQPFVPKNQDEYEYIKSKIDVNNRNIWFPLVYHPDLNKDIYEDGTVMEDNPFNPASSEWYQFGLKKSSDYPCTNYVYNQGLSYMSCSVPETPTLICFRK